MPNPAQADIVNELYSRRDTLPDDKRAVVEELYGRMNPPGVPNPLQANPGKYTPSGLQQGAIPGGVADPVDEVKGLYNTFRHPVDSFQADPAGTVSTWALPFALAADTPVGRNVIESAKTAAPAVGRFAKAYVAPKTGGRLAKAIEAAKVPPPPSSLIRSRFDKPMPSSGGAPITPTPTGIEGTVVNQPWKAPAWTNEETPAFNQRPVPAPISNGGAPFAPKDTGIEGTVISKAPAPDPRIAPAGMSQTEWDKLSPTQQRAARAAATVQQQRVANPPAAGPVPVRAPAPVAPPAAPVNGTNVAPVPAPTSPQVPNAGGVRGTHDMPLVTEVAKPKTQAPDSTIGATPEVQSPATKLADTLHGQIPAAKAENMTQEDWNRLAKGLKLENPNQRVISDALEKLRQREANTPVSAPTSRYAERDQTIINHLKESGLTPDQFEKLSPQEQQGYLNKLNNKTGSKHAFRFDRGDQGPNSVNRILNTWRSQK